MQKKRWLFLAVLIFVMEAASASALTVLQLNLQQMTWLAERVFVGTCISVKAEKDSSGKPVQYVTYEVSDMIKGTAADRVTFKQLGATEDQITRGDETIVGVFRELPRYRVGEESVVFLSEEGVLGLTAPIGLGQGKFVVQEHEGGKTVINGMGNRGLFGNSKFKALTQQKSGEMDYDAFVSLVKQLATPEVQK